MVTHMKLFHTLNTFYSHEIITSRAMPKLCSEKSMLSHRTGCAIFRSQSIFCGQITARKSVLVRNGKMADIVSKRLRLHRQIFVSIIFQYSFNFKAFMRVLSDSRELSLQLRAARHANGTGPTNPSALLVPFSGSMRDVTEEMHIEGAKV